MSTNVLVACAIVVITTVAILVVLYQQGRLGLGSSISQGIGISTSVGNSSGTSSTITKDPAIFITGPSNSGKTALFTVLTSDKLRNTVISQSANVKKNFHGTKVSLIDFPGHVKLRYKLFEELSKRQQATAAVSGGGSSSSKGIGKLKGIMFMVDATIDPKSLTTTAEFLLEVLKYTELFPEPVDVLIACNKSESFIARPASKIKDILEKEIEECINRSKVSLSGAGVGKDEDGTVGNTTTMPTADFVEAVARGERFSFEMLEGTVEVAGGSVIKCKTGKWEEWLDDRLASK